MIKTLKKTKSFFVSWGIAFSCLLFTLLGTPSSTFASPLPPKFEDFSAHWIPDIKSSTALRASRVDFLYDQPIPHAQIRWERASSRVFVSNADGSASFVVAAPETGVKNSQPVIHSSLSWPTSASPEPRSLQHQMGLFLFQGRKMEYKERSAKSDTLWSIDLGFHPLDVDQFGGSFSAWVSYPESRLFQLGPRGDRAFRGRWSPDSQIVRFSMCDTKRPKSVVVENVKNGLTRLVFLGRKMNILGHTIFDFGKNIGPGDISQVIVGQGCEDFLFAGAFGLVRVNYPFGAVQGLE